MSGAGRREDIAANLRAVRARIVDAAAAAGRSADDVTLVVVTKTFPPDDVRILADLGVRDVGENRHPEAEHKAAALADLDLVWHFVGQVQTNKARRIASYADVVHSVDSVRRAERLDDGAQAHGRTLRCFVQVDLDPPEEHVARGGVAPRGVAEVAAAVATAEALELAGVMAVAPLGRPAAPAFDRLTEVARELRRSHPAATAISAGMTADFAEAIRAGATHVRIGSAILGSRPPLR